MRLQTPFDFPKQTAPHLMVCIVALLFASVSWAQIADVSPSELEGIEITEHLEAQLPLDTTLMDEYGKTVRLADFFKNGKPVIVSPVYFECPMLCNLVINGMIDVFQQMEWTPGEQFEVLTFSFNPSEGRDLAKLKKQNVIREYGRPEGAAGWHFLTGQKDQVESLTQSLGFGYRWDEKTRQYAHRAALILCTPDGRISRYLYGIQFDPKTLRLSLVEASEGKVGSTVDRVFLTCFRYDAELGRYSVAAMGLMRVGGLLTMLVLGGTLGTLWTREARRRRAAAAVANQPRQRVDD